MSTVFEAATKPQKKNTPNNIPKEEPLFFFAINSFLPKVFIFL
jgi:hypothetical protein